MQITLSSKLSQFAHLLQEELFPRLAAALDAPITDRQALFIAACSMVPLGRFIPCGRWKGRPSKDRRAIARAFLAKSVYGLQTTRQLLHLLTTDSTVRRLCGWTDPGHLPHESTFSRAFAEFALSDLPQFAHQALIAHLHREQLVGHIARDASAIAVRERFPEQPPEETPKPRKKKKAKRGARKGPQPRLSRAARLTKASRIEKQLQQSDPAKMLAEIPTHCSIGVKRSTQGNRMYWRGYKLHLDVADGQIPITALLTSASVHDSQVAIPLMHLTSQRVTYLYDVMDSAYDAAAIHAASQKLNHKPIIQPHRRPKPVTQLPVRIKPQPEMAPAQRERYKTRTAVERVFGRLKDEFGARHIRVRGAKKVMAHLMFGIVVLTVDQLLRLRR